MICTLYYGCFSLHIVWFTLGQSVTLTAYSPCPHLNVLFSARSKFWGVSGSEDRGGGDNSIQFINIGRVGDKSFKEWRRKIGEWKGG